MELVGTIFELVKCFGGPTCRYIDHHRKLEQNLNDLKRRVDDLNIRKQDIELRKEAEIRRRKVVKKEVEKWFEDVERINIETQSIEEKFRYVSFLSRARLGKLVCRKIEEVKALYQQGSFSDGVAIDGPAAAGVTLPTTNLEGEIDVKERIWEYLMGDEVGMIGVCGMGGTGKTTIMKHINNQLLEGNRFDKVVWVTVLKELTVYKLQEDIAQAMDVSLPRNQLERATELMKMLKEMRHMLILDDVWKRFSLLDVGIPFPTSQSGSKMVLTSRSIEVCKSMGCEIVKVQPLSAEESFNLFLNQVGRHGILEDPTVQNIAKLIVEQCGGLPLAIVTIAGTMKGVDDIFEWRNALNELRERVKSVKGLHTEIFECLMFSYHRLGDPIFQNCFLYCSLYPEDYKIERRELIEKWIDEGLLHELETRQAMHDRGHSILNKLEDNCLLERATHDFRGKVSMHDLLRDMALFIRRQFMVKAGMQSKEFPSEHEWTSNLEKVSLMNNSFSEIPPHTSPKCHSLSTLLLQRNAELERMPESFFEHIHGLKILDLSDTRISKLPDSISNLENLVALVLQNCHKLRYICSLSKLKALRKLDLFNTDIKEVPHGIEMLTNLTYLTFYSKDLKELPIGILSMLSQLQHFATTLNVKGEEAAKLRKLEVFLGSFMELEDFGEYIKSILEQGPPNNYFLAVGSPKPDYFYFDDGSRFYQNPKFNKEVCLINCKIGREVLLMLPNDLNYLSIEECHGFRSLSSIHLVHEGNELKSCYIRKCEGIECVIDQSLSSCNSLRNIEKLQLEGLCNLHELARVELAAPAIFSSLKCIYLRNCSTMKNLFSLELLQGIQNLEEIDVSHCKKMEKIIASEDDEKHDKPEASASNITFILPKLRKLSLFKLPELKSICSFRVKIPTNSLQHLEVIECRKLKRIPLTLPLLDNGQPFRHPRIEEIVLYPKEWSESVEWDDPNVKDMLSPYHLAEVGFNSEKIPVLARLFTQSTKPNQKLKPLLNL